MMVSNMSDGKGRRLTRDDVLAKLKREFNSSRDMAENCAYAPQANRAEIEARIWR
jgi:hypothetical protein